MEERNGNRRTSHNPPSGVYHGTFSKASSKVSGKASGLKWKIAVCILIIIAVLIVKKFDGQAKNRVIGAIAEYYGRDYSVEDVVSAVSGGLKKAEDIPAKIREGVSGGEEQKEKSENAETTAEDESEGEAAESGSSDRSSREGEL